MKFHPASTTNFHLPCVKVMYTLYGHVNILQNFVNSIPAVVKIIKENFVQ